MVIGITGGVGSGKSTISDILHEKYGYLVLRTDDMAKELERPGNAVYNALVEAFGEVILEPATQSGSPREISKSAFGDLIYNDHKAMIMAEGIIHPATWGWCEKIIAEERERGETRIIVETALPCERYRRMCDEIWFVYADEDTRVNRLMESRGYSREKCRRIISEQLSDVAFIGYADHIIDNSAGLEETMIRVNELMEDSI